MIKQFHAMNGDENAMQKCELDEPFGRKDVLKAILDSKVDQVEQAIIAGDFKEAITLLDEAALVSQDAGETEMALAFSRQANTFRARIGMKDEEAVMGYGHEPDESYKPAFKKKWLRDMLLVSMRKTINRIQNNSRSR